MEYELTLANVSSGSAVKFKRFFERLPVSPRRGEKPVGESGTDID